MFQDKKLEYGGKGMSYRTGRCQQNVIIVPVKSQSSLHLTLALLEGNLFLGKLGSMSQSFLMVRKSLAQAHSLSPQDEPDLGTFSGVSGWPVATFK